MQAMQRSTVSSQLKNLLDFVDVKIVKAMSPSLFVPVSQLSVASVKLDLNCSQAGLFRHDQSQVAAWWEKASRLCMAYFSIAVFIDSQEIFYNVMDNPKLLRQFMNHLKRRYSAANLHDSGARSFIRLTKNHS